ncbi:uncharacterized protein LOC114355208 [Ostrinia furnacalis]|uniref:uncharacterized protein LOC114355208 n=1 Tax=Ostrinia furnacalis TaxID=93504 RepID=UPI00103B589A|nr:uncharacterized protein LOC114355208 [Ostrinia furnacalis]
MPCKCSGVRYDKCKCRFLGTGFQMPNGANSRVMILAQKESSCCIHSSRPKRNIFIRVFECVYERCAGYNLRYCPIRGFRMKNCMNEALRDLLVLMCFMLANFVVFLTIFARMTMHMSAVLVQSARWVRRFLLVKMVENKNDILLSSVGTQQVHSFTPPNKVF